VSDADHDVAYTCRFGYHHVVPSLAVGCTGAVHGLADE
jgi:hypothetical protein